MSYPVLSRAEAKLHLAAVFADEDPPPLAVRTKEGGPDLDWDEVATRLRDDLSKVQVQVGDLARSGASKMFEALAAVVVHKMMPDHVALSDPEFWTWLTVTHFTDLVRWRYPDSTSLANYGVGAAAENLVYRAWLRGEIAYREDAEEPYALATVGDVDFWRSHVFRQSYGDGRSFAQALIAYQFPAEQQGRPRLKIDDIRELAKRLKTARSNLHVEVMSVEAATRFIAAEAAKIAAT